MGADIHIYIEKSVEGGPWEYQEPVLEDRSARWSYSIVPCDSRDYALFGRLAGVRNEMPEYYCTLPEGVPYDSCAEIVSEFKGWAGEAHSEHHCSFDEYAKRLLDPNAYWRAGKSAAQATTLFKSLELMGLIVDTEYRVVFWFDN